MGRLCEDVFFSLPYSLSVSLFLSLYTSPSISLSVFSVCHTHSLDLYPLSDWHTFSLYVSCIVDVGDEEAMQPNF